MTEEVKHENSKNEEPNVLKERTREEKRKTAYKVVNETLLKEHAFWANEPLGKRAPDSNEKPADSSKQLLDASLELDIEIRQIDLQTEISSVCELLMGHYIEDGKGKFSLQYSPEFIKWQLESPYAYPEWNIGVFTEGTLIGFISATAIDIKIKESTPKTAVVNFLCVHKKYRKRRLVPLLIKEVTKEVNKKGIFSALFTSGEKLPYIFTRSRYYHRILREGPLVESGFCDQEDVENATEDEITLHDSETVQYRRIKEEELPEAYKMYCNKYQQLDLSANFTYEQFKYYVYGKERISDMLISQDGSEFVSMFYLATKPAENNATIRTAYLSYHTMRHGVGSMQGVIRYLKNMDECDVFNALELESNTEDILVKSGFLKGDGVINYYLFNWDTELIPASRNSFTPY
ncbi:hypothetical protein NERG_01593 [Nematocida ausubeli]|uniref:Glycylpeptide N-tetradecanoyltransferase n=1 Tax=Nematocida ausubeli (strain ATCC PRA-371 / ERTm2) TaxID=1913371 RepID=H8ZDC2_NEMA1|nr:hypothetical protein NERG_01593 [Nematocida ausubeli]